MIEDLLRETIGMDVSSVGKGKIDADIGACMRRLGIVSRDGYEKLLRNSPDEQARLIETVTIPETWFFRVRGSFDALAQRLRELRDCGRAVRILSVPCSTGEEAYSIVITLFECGYSEGGFRVDAVDVSGVCIEKALSARYTANSFRGVGEHLQRDYFRREGKCFCLDERIARQVNFSRRNIFEFVNIAVEERYDVVFCRNMLIYLDSGNQKRAVDVLDSLLRDDGILFIGHSEAGIFFDSVFEPVCADGSFSYRRKTVTARDGGKAREWCFSVPVPVPVPVRRDAKALEPPSRKRRAVEFKELEIKKQPDAELADESPLARAERLAGDGELAMAEEICQACIAADKLDARAYCLLGMLRLSSRNYADAGALFSKVLYLSPDCYEALLGMVSVYEHLGNEKLASQFRQRAGRVGS